MASKSKFHFDTTADKIRALFTAEEYTRKMLEISQVSVKTIEINNDGYCTDMKLECTLGNLPSFLKILPKKILDHIEGFVIKEEWKERNHMITGKVTSINNVFPVTTTTEYECVNDEDGKGVTMHSITSANINFSGAAFFMIKPLLNSLKPAIENFVSEKVNASMVEQEKLIKSML